MRSPWTVVPSDSPIDTWLCHLARWSGDPRVTMVIPAHGPMGGVGLVRRTATYLRGLLDGTPVEVPASLTAFYRETHDANLKWRLSPTRSS